jgi:hypothetical protein
MRLILALLIATFAGVGMGYWHGYATAVHDQLNHAKPQTPPSYFDDYYADPATRPTTRPTRVPRRRDP